jgi:hypothetical protein
MLACVRTSLYDKLECQPFLRHLLLQMVTEIQLAAGLLAKQELD